jgi:CDP-paratose 2-epimerase
MNDAHSKRRDGRTSRAENSHATKRVRSKNRLKKINGFRKLANGDGNGHTSWGRNGHGQKPILLTGGAGFIGTNLAHRLLEDGKHVLIFDNLSRAGVEHNLEWLQSTHPARLDFQAGSILDSAALGKAVARASHVFHFAAQVAVTTSLENPIYDFKVNALGTLNLLEAIRCAANPPSLVFTSTNKVYGELGDVKLRALKSRYEPLEPKVRKHGFSEDRPLAFHSPYGCSKGAACQYVLDYARTFGLRTAVFRMSCIYGPHQFGNEDQGWVAHFLIKALKGEPITIYGDGRQVRDILFIDDLVNAFLLAKENITSISGQAFNIGGGPANTISLLELLELISELQGNPTQAHFSDWREADQKYYVSDPRKFQARTGWSSRTGVRKGVAELYHWLEEFGVPAHQGNGASEKLSAEPAFA